MRSQKLPGPTFLDYCGRQTDNQPCQQQKTDKTGASTSTHEEVVVTNKATSENMLWF